MMRILLAATALIILSTQSARANDAPLPDKSAYTLFNPVPDELMRSFATDRPAKSSSATTVDAGHLQYESDILSWLYDRYSPMRTTTSDLVVFDSVMKMGLTEHTDLEIALAPINANHTTDRTTDAHASSFGFGDATARMKFNLFGNEGGTYALALVPYVKAPTAAVPIGNGHWEGGGYVPFTINLPNAWSVTFQTELDILENADMNGMHPNYQNLINVGYPISGAISGQAEIWSDVSADHNTPSQYTFDLAALWAVTNKLQLDLGANMGLNKAAPDVQVYTGISQRF